MKFFEISKCVIEESYGRPNETYQGFELWQHEDREDDNTKIFHEIKVPGKNVHSIDYSPYSEMSLKELRLLVEFYKITGRFPDRHDIPSPGPMHSEDLPKIFRRLATGKIAY